MDKNFEPELKGTLEQAINAQQEILKYFKRCGESGHQDANKHQLVFACKIASAITKCKETHLDIYFHIITETFGDKLKPECNLKYWTLYVNCIRYIHYTLVTKKEYELAAAIYKYISSFKTKLQSSEIGITLLNMYAAQLLLQTTLKLSDSKTALQNANDVIESLAKLFKELLDTNKQLNFQYPDILKTALQCLFPRNTMASVFKFLNLLSAAKVKKMFTSLFALFGQQTIEALPSQEEVQCHAQFIIETLHSLMQIDLMNKFQLQLTLELLNHCRTEYRLRSYQPVAEFLLTLHDYLKLLFNQKTEDAFLPSVFNARIERFKKLFDDNSKSLMSQLWFGDLLVLLCYLHSQLQNVQIFPCFWQHMSKPDCYRAVFKLFTECLKLASCISGETKLFAITCCTSIRKHVIISFAQTAISYFVFYCQNVAVNEENKETLIGDNNATDDSYKETIHQPLIIIVNYALKIISNMECITGTSQELNILLTRFKQATINAKTSRQAGTCLSICELFLNIKTKIPSHEWPLILRRLYKVVTGHVISPPNLGRDIQMCYIASMLDKSIEQIDIGQIRTQINIFYTTECKTIGQVPHESCLMQLYYTTKCAFKPHLEPARKKLLHWLESQCILRYNRSNTQLVHSLIKHSQSEYDFVIIAKEAKLEAYAQGKISSICKTFSAKTQQLDGLGRLEHLTYGHALTILVLQQFKSHKLQVNSKDLNEDDLEQLLMREEMSSITINDELKLVKLSLKAFKAFEQFYEKFDSETISMDDAIIDWEHIMEDLDSLANYLQISGYLDYCSQVYLLLYKCSRLLQNDKYALKSLAFVCEYSDYYESRLNIDNEIELNFNAITVALENVSTISWSSLNTFLLAILQIAYYYARSNRYNFAQILLQFVVQKHKESPERQGGYDIVLATLDAVKFRLLWKSFEHNSSNNNTDNKRELEACLLYEMDLTLERFHDFKYGNDKATDGLIFSILAINLLLEYSECTANRLCDNFIISIFYLTMKISLQYGLALRLVQIMSRWMWVNLQMEYVDKAQTQLKFMQYVMCAKTLKELTEKCDKAKIDIKSKTDFKSNIDMKSNIISNTPAKDLLPLNCNNNNNMEAMRKLVPVQLSPIKTDKLKLSPGSRNHDLNSYFDCNIDITLMPKNEIIEWTYFTMGCLNARLYYLVEDYDQLQEFYENSNKWFQNRQNSFYKQYYANIQLLTLKHQANFLRSQRQYASALENLKFAVEMSDGFKFKIDVVYNVNLRTQLFFAKMELEGYDIYQNLNPIRRALDFNMLPECNSEPYEKAQNKLKEKMIKQAMASSKTEGKTSSSSSLKTVVSGSAAKSCRKPKTQSCTIGVEAKSIKPKQKLKFNICEDSMEIIVSDESINELDRPILEIIDSDESKNSLECDEEVKHIKRTKTIEINDQHKTPKIPKTATKTTDIPEKQSKIKRPPFQQSIEIDLTDSPLATRLPTSSSSTSLDKVEANEIVDIVQEMTKLEIEVVTKSKATGTKPKSRGRKPALVKQLSAPLIILTDSPGSSRVANPGDSKETDVKKTTKTRKTSDKTPLETRTRRQRKLILEKDENDNMPTSSSVASSSSTVSSRRRHKI